METPISPKILAGGAAGALTVVLVYILSLFGVDIPAEVASAITVLITAIAGYVKRDPLRVPVADGNGGHRAVPPADHVG